jgi:hypothetical protein
MRSANYSSILTVGSSVEVVRSRSSTRECTNDGGGSIRVAAAQGKQARSAQLSVGDFRSGDVVALNGRN